MILERRVITFSSVTFIDALRRYSNHAGTRLPDIAPETLIFDPGKETALIIRFAQEKYTTITGSWEFVLTYDQVVDALCLYCHEHLIPLPKGSMKQLEKFDEGAALMMQVVQPESFFLQANKDTINPITRILPRVSRGKIPQEKLFTILWEQAAFCIIDHNARSRREFKSIISGLKATHIDECSDAYEFIELMDLKEFHVVIINTGTVDLGNDFIATIRRQESRSRFARGLAILPSKDVPGAEKFLDAGFHEVIAAPYSTNDIMCAIDCLLTTPWHWESPGKASATE
ncbi:MAG: hypothetical protein HQL37_00840 [Alphaproteobacteria bacterium]|nr:hypothetical protein [Alphaproteobacteria bacterium]